MPGRGQPWKGVGFGVPDRIGTGAIADGSITEADLDSNVTSKLNAGGHQIQDEGTPLTDRPELNFVGAGVVASDDGEKTVVTIAGGTGHIIEDEGTPLTNRPDLNFVGAGVTATDDSEVSKTIITIPIQPAYATVQDEGTPLTQRTEVDFVGAGVTVTDDSELTKTIVTIPGGSGITRELVSNPFTDMYLYDEFFYPTPATGLNTHYEKIGTFSAPTNVLHGQVQFQTSTVANNVTRINTCGAGFLALDPLKNFRLVWRARKVTSDVNIAVLLGCYRDQGSKPGGVFPFASIQPDHAHFRSDGTGNWFAEIHNGTTPTSTDTGVVSDTLFHTFEFRSNPAVPNIEALIDGAVVATFTTNLPNNNVAIFAGVQTGTTSAKSIVVDSFYMYQDR